MARREPGFTLIEVLIILALIAIIAAIAIPNLLAARRAANETAAVATLRSIIAAQVQFRDGATIDVDRDGTGEYGGFLELSGESVRRSTVGAEVPAVLSGAFRVLSPNGEVSRSGYLFRIYLPKPGGGGLPEPDTAYEAADIDPDLAEALWCCYAWPADHKRGGHRTLFTNQEGKVLGCEGVRYSGTGNGPAHDAAFRAPDITGETALGLRGRDGNTWSRVR